MRQNILNLTHDASAELFIIFDNNYYCLESNKSFSEQLLNFNSKNLNFLDLIHLDDSQGFQQFIENKGNSSLFEFRLKIGNEKYNWFKISKNSIIRYQDEILVVIRNIDFEKKTYTHLMQLEQVAEIGTWEIDVISNELYWSEMTYKIHEVTTDYKPKIDDGLSFYHEESIPLLKMALENTAKNGQGYDLKLKFITAKGNHRWVHVICKVEFKAGNLVRSYGSIQDITHDYENEIKMRESNERFNAIVNNIPIMLSLFNENGEFEWINKGWTSELGWDIDSMKNRDMMVEFYPDQEYRKEVLDFMINAVSGWKDFYIKKSDGSFIHTSWANIKLSNGKSIGIGQNIEERKKLEKEISTASKNLQLAIDAAGFGIWEYFPKSEKVIFSKKWCEMLGFDVNKISHDVKTWEKCVHPDHIEEAWKKMSACMNHEIDFFESTQMLKNSAGEWIWIYTRGQIIEHDSNGQPVRFLALSNDVTKQKNFEDSLKESNLKLQSLNERMELALKVTKFGVWDWDLKTMVLNWDQYMFELFAFPEKDFKNDFSSFESRLLPDDNVRINSELEDCFKKNKKEFKSEFKIKIPSSEEIKIIAVTALCFYDKQGKPSRLIGTNWDITEQRKSEIKLIESSKFATLGEMAAGIAHEINNPLTIIKGKADQISLSISKNNLDLEKLKIEIDKISSTAQRIAKIINGLRSFSRDSSNEPFANTELAKVIEDSVSMCFEKFKSRGVKFMHSVPLSLMVECRPIQLSQVILNLLNNAFDAALSQSDKWIHLDVTEHNDLVKITVTDCGQGIPEASAKKLMMPFFTTKDIGKGTGLGLSISKGIIDDHKGRLYYDHLSANTRFVIELPKKVSN